MGILWATPRQVGNCVQIKDTLIPSLGIFLGEPAWDSRNFDYQVYFEIMFEDGGHWVVRVPFYPNDRIVVDMYRRAFDMDDVKTYLPDLIRKYKSWKEFLYVYKERVKPHGHEVRYENGKCIEWSFNGAVYDLA